MADNSLYNIKQLLSDPLISSTSGLGKIKQRLSLLEQFRPDLFTDPNKTNLPKKGEWYGAGAEPIQKYPEVAAQGSAQKVAQRAAFGDIISTPTYEKFASQGILPEVKGKSLLGTISTNQKFALQKILSGLGTYGRQLAATNKVAKQYTNTIPTEDFNKLSLDEKLKLLANPANNLFAVNATGKIETSTPMTVKELKETGKAFGQATINKKGTPYENYYTANLYKEMYPSFAKEMPAAKAWTENTPIQRLKGLKGFDWLTKKWAWAIPPAAIIKATEAALTFGAEATKTPANIAGLFTEVFADPLIQLSGGLTKGAKTGLKASEDIIVGGKTILPAGSEIGLSQTGRKVINPLVEEASNDIMNFLSENQAKGLLKYPAIENPIYAKALKTNIIKKISEPIIKETASKLSYGEAIKLFDFGGLKFMSETVIPGYKFTELANIGKNLSKSTLKDNALKQFVSKIINTWQEAFVPSAKYPADIYPHYQAIESASKARIGEGANLLGDLIKKNDVKKSDFPILADYLGYSKDISDIDKEVVSLESKLNLINNVAGKQKLFKAIDTKVNKIEELKNLLPDLSNKANLQNFLKDYKTKFLDEFLYQPEKAFGVEYTPRDIYYPQRLQNVKKGFLPNAKEIGSETARFQFAQETPYWKLKNFEDIGQIKMKGFLESNLTRTVESSTAISRKELANVIRTVSEFKPTKGYSLTSLPELKGMYVPDELIPQLEKIAKPFFGEDSAKYMLGLYDRALGLWKQVALATPGYQFRNFYTDIVSGLFEWGVEFLNPENWFMALQARAGKPIRYTDNFGNVITKTLKELRSTGTAGVSQTAIEALSPGFSVAKGNPFKYLARAGVVREDLGRIVGHIIESKAGASDIMATSVVKKVFFDYMELTPVERNAMKRVIPFYTWLRKNSVRQFELLAKRTGRFATLSKSLNFANQASGLTAEEKANMPEYFKTDAYTKTPFKTKEGFPLFFNPNFGFQDIARIFSPQDIASAITPIAKWPIELFANKEIFSGYPIRSESFGKQYPIDYQKEAPRFLQFMRKFDNSLLNKIGLAKDEKGTVKMSDMFAYAFKQMPAFYTAQRMFPNQIKAKTPYDWLSILLGIKLTPLDINKEKTNRLHELENDLNSAIDEYNKLNPSTAIPTNSEIEKAYKTIALNYIYNKNNMKQVDQLQEIKDMGGGSKELNLMLTLAKQPYNEQKKQISDMNMEAVIKYLQSLGINPTKQEIRDIIKNQ